LAIILLTIFVLVPAIEIVLFIWTGGHIGVWSVFALILITGILGTLVVRHEGTETLRRAQLAMQSGDIPTEQLLDGICIIIGAVLLITPGFFTDAVGFLIVFPLTRHPFKLLLKRIIKKSIEKGNFIYRRW